MPLAIRDMRRKGPVAVARLRSLGARVLAALGRPEMEVHVTLVDDPAIKRLNARYVGARQATDVLAFQLEAPGPSRLLGEIVISAETAARQARRVGVPLARELDLLLVHGLLHLVGYDDRDPREARLMHERAREILSEAGRGPRDARARDPLWAGLLDER